MQLSRRNMRRMPNGDNTVIVRDLIKMEPQIHPILEVAGEVNKLGIGDVRTCGGCGRHFKKSEIIVMTEWDLATWRLGGMAACLL
ncbi:hypothetical protein Acr_00g0025330 [Actinidia rufa]|uniref:Uncharacterized protein n=1 Tax=Actinidia rufa TaxID=165716 RepID=A0A7J0DF72_9ERIC|nr:hypothetical protein Acr_00g0025330 [Actinidia rufa]